MATPPNRTRMFGKLLPKEFKRQFIKHDPKDSVYSLPFDKYLLNAIPPLAPLAVNYEYKVNGWQVFGNDTIGDCTAATIAHMMMLWTKWASVMETPSLFDVLQVYSAVSGYDPLTGANDNGAAITDVLDYCRVTGMSGRKILGWARIDHRNINHIKQAINLFGAVNLGVQFPQSALDQNMVGATWELVPGDGGIIGGHAVPLFGYTPKEVTCVTWGTLQDMSWEWLLHYADEAYGVVTLDWMKLSGQSASNYNMKQLQADLLSLKA